MTTRLARPTLIAAFTLAFLTPNHLVVAQTVPEGQSCGGLLCDMGVFGHKTAPPPQPPPAAVSAPVAPAAATAGAAPGGAGLAEPAAPESKARPVRKRHRVAKAAASVSTRRPVAPQPSAIAAAPADAPPRSVPPPAPTPAPAPAPAATASGPSILNPFALPPSPTVSFRPIY